MRQLAVQLCKAGARFQHTPQLTSATAPLLLPQYAAVLPDMLDYADSRKWAFWHDQAS